MMVEVLGGILSGGPFGRHIRYWKNDPRPAKYVSFVPSIIAVVDLCCMQTAKLSTVEPKPQDLKVTHLIRLLGAAGNSEGCQHMYAILQHTPACHLNAISLGPLFKHGAPYSTR